MKEKTASTKNQSIRAVKFNKFKIGGEKTFNFMDRNSLPVYVLELPIFNTEDNYEFVKKYYKTCDSKKLVSKAQETDCDILGLRFNIEKTSQVEEAQTLLKELLPSIEKPLMIRGVSDNTLNKELLPALVEVLDRESIVAFADENTYKEIIPSVIKGNHVLVIRTPIDINLAKEMNILSSDMGLGLDKILVDTDIGGLGYGLEYGYSTMEKIKLEGFGGNKYLNMPMISFAGEESLKVKEAKSDKFSKSWGDLKSRALMFEISAASAVAAAGVNAIVLNHPLSLKAMKGLE